MQYSSFLILSSLLLTHGSTAIAKAASETENQRKPAASGYFNDTISVDYSGGTLGTLYRLIDKKQGITCYALGSALACAPTNEKKLD